MSFFQRSRLWALVLPVGLTACMSGEGPIDPSRQPELPPVGSLAADFSFFDASAGSGGGTSAWLTAQSRVKAADTVIARVFAVPFGALEAAHAVTPMRTGGLWRWPINFAVDGVSYSGELRGLVTGGRYGWDLVLSSQGHIPQLEDYLWATGLTTADGFQGQWNIGYSAAGSDSIEARTSWVLSLEGLPNVGFTVNDTTGWIYERASGAGMLTYVVYGLPQNRVTWFPGTGVGNTWSAASGLTHCWDPNRNDANC